MKQKSITADPSSFGGTCHPGNRLHEGRTFGHEEKKNSLRSWVAPHPGTCTSKSVRTRVWWKQWQRSLQRLLVLFTFAATVAHVGAASRHFSMVTVALFESYRAVCSLNTLKIRNKPSEWAERWFENQTDNQFGVHENQLGSSDADPSL